MDLEFDEWNNIKKDINNKKTNKNLFFHEREVWWVNLGKNIGVEANGKNEIFERPVLIIKKFNSEMIWALPVTFK
jgi:mRNA interferase MazF